jgi:hypothetical protein
MPKSSCVAHDARMMNTNEAYLLDLPRELRDMIIDEVLLAGNPAPNASRCGQSCDDVCCHDVNSGIPPMAWPSISLVNIQLHNEVSQMAAKLDIPLILDMLVLANGKLHCTWLNVPFTNDWREVRMMENVRLQPVETDTSTLSRLEFLDALYWCNPDKYQSTDIRDYRHRQESDMWERISRTLWEAVTVFLSASPPGTKEIIEVPLPKTHAQHLSAIKEIRINVNAATTHLPDGTEKQYWRPDTDTARFADGLADHIHESWYDYVDRALHHQGPDNWDRLENWEHIGEGLRVLLSRVGRLETRADEGVWEIDMDEMMEWLEAICARK